jgi:hypothetical protein
VPRVLTTGCSEDPALILVSTYLKGANPKRPVSATADGRARRGRRQDSHCPRLRSARRPSRPAGLSRNPVSRPERPAPGTPHQPGSVAVLTSHTPSRSCPRPVFIPAITKQAWRSRDRTGDQDHLPIQTAIVEPVRCRGQSPQSSRTCLRGSSTPAQRLSGRSGQRIKLQDHHVTMILIYPGPRLPRPGVTSAVPRNNKYCSLPALRLMVGKPITRRRLAATSSSCLALLVI